MEYCDQGTLASYLLAHNGKPVTRTAIICQIFAGLNYLFQVGVIHLDIKPQNILVASGPTFKLADFGLAKQLKNSNKTSIEQSQLKCGTMEYIPYFAENTTYFRDLYAFYCLLYYITTHHHLNSGKPVKPVTKRWSSMDTEPIRPNIFTDTEFSCLGNVVQILAKLQTAILSILKKPAQIQPGARASKLENIKGVLSFGSNSGSGSNSANNIITQSLVKQTQRRKLVLNRYDLYSKYYKMLDAELDVISKVHAKPSIVMPAPPHKKPVTISTKLSGTKTKTDVENANNASVAEPPLTPVKPRY
jgi:serine/threonine protein kinase